MFVHSKSVKSTLQSTMVVFTSCRFCHSDSHCLVWRVWLSCVIILWTMILSCLRPRAQKVYSQTTLHLNSDQANPLNLCMYVRRLASADWISSPALLGRLSPGRKSLIGCGTLATTFCTTGTRRKLNMIDCPNHTKPPPQIQNMHQILKTTHIKLEIVSLLYTKRITIPVSDQYVRQICWDSTLEQIGRSVPCS